MLTTTRTSRTRLVAGAGVLSLCVAAGLVLTASGTVAAAKVRSTVEMRPALISPALIKARLRRLRRPLWQHR